MLHQPFLEQFICQNSCLWQAPYAFLDPHIYSTLFVGHLFEFISFDECWWEYSKRHVHVLGIWEQGSKEKILMSAVMNLEVFVKITKLMRIFSIVISVVSVLTSPR